MRDIAQLQALYEQGVYTFGEVVTALVCEADERAPEALARELSPEFADGVEAAVRALPETATADDIVIIKSSRAHAEKWFRGAMNWRRHLADRSSAA